MDIKNVLEADQPKFQETQGHIAKSFISVLKQELIKADSKMSASMLKQHVELTSNPGLLHW